MTVDKYGKKWDRFYCTIVTPFKDNDDVDEAAFRKFLKYFMQPKFRDINGGIIVSAQAGELDHLSREERKRNLEIAMDECGGKVPVFTGVGGTRTRDAVQTAIDAKEIGADGIMLFTPVGGAGSDPEQYPEVWMDYAKTVVDAIGDMPVIGHPVGRFHPLWGIGWPLKQTIETCNAIPNVIGWKMVYPLETHPVVAKGLRSLDHHVGVFEAPGLFFHDSLAKDYIDGAVSGSFNYAMELMADHMNCWKNNDIVGAKKIWLSGGLEDLHEFLYVPMNRLHVRYKIAAWLRGFIPSPYMRRPLPRPRLSEVAALKMRLKKCGFEVIPEKDINKVTSSLLP